VNSEHYTRFYSDEGDEYRYRPTVDYASDLAHDRLAFCSACTQTYDDLGPDTYLARCLDCKQHTVFGHLHFDKIV
jgi:hypothetical protein